MEGCSNVKARAESVWKGGGTQSTNSGFQALCPADTGETERRRGLWLRFSENGGGAQENIGFIKGNAQKSLTDTQEFDTIVTILYDDKKGFFYG